VKKFKAIQTLNYSEATMDKDSSPSANQDQPLFALGQVVATRGAFNAMNKLGISANNLIFRHVTGDWGDLCESDQRQNVIAVNSSMRIFSSYQINDDGKIWIITEADRSSTTLLLPSEY
jgi:hypothetical protein